MGYVPQGHLEWPLAWLLISTSFELASSAMSGLDVFIRTNSVLVQHWEPPWHQVNGATVLEGRNSVSLL